MKTMISLLTKRNTLTAVGVLITAFSLQPIFAEAGTIAQCGEPVCASNFSVYFDGSSTEVGGGQFLYDATTGNIALDTSSIRGNGTLSQDGSLMWTMGDGSQVMVNSISGNADPILGFGLGASTQSNGRTFAFSFDLPIVDLTGPILAESSISYSLTATSSAGAQISTLGNNNVLRAFDIDTTVGGIGSLNKGVDVGEAFFFLDGPQTQNSPVYTASNIFTGNSAYDLMSVQLNFALSANSTVGLSGFTSQTAVPIPAAFPLFLFGLAGMGILLRKRSSRNN